MPIIIVDVARKARRLNIGLCINLSNTTTLCMQAAKALASLRMCADSPEPSLLTDVISSKNLVHCPV